MRDKRSASAVDMEMERSADRVLKSAREWVGVWSRHLTVGMSCISLAPIWYRHALGATILTATIAVVQMARCDSYGVDFGP